jgi:hypothetical protein
VVGRKCESKGDESEENQEIKIQKFRTVRIKLFECLIEHIVRQKGQVAFKGQIK